MRKVFLDGNTLTLAQLQDYVVSSDIEFQVETQALTQIKKSRDYIEARLKKGDVMYGVNTGFGAFSSVRISDADIEQLQKNLIRSHSVGIGEPFTKYQSKAM